MESPAVSRPYFSPNPQRERFCLILAWAITLVSALILVLFWQSTRDLGLILFLQDLRSAPVELLFRVFTFLGDDQFYMVFFSVLLWCVSKPLGFWTAFVLLTSGTYSGLIKDMTVLERPPLPGIVQPDNHAFPSGHTLTAITVWGYLAARQKKKALWVWAIAAIVMIGASRMILGYHFLGDILGGLALGIPFLLFVLWLSVIITERGIDRSLSLAVTIALALLLPALLVLILPGSDPIKLMGYLSGAAIGYALEKEKIRSVVQAPFMKQVLKTLLGAAVLFAIIIGLGGLLPSSVAPLGYLRYFLGGIWVTLFAPVVFTKLRLSGKEKQILK